MGIMIETRSHLLILQDNMWVAGDWIQPQPGGNTKLWNTIANLAAMRLVSILELSKG